MFNNLKLSQNPYFLLISEMKLLMGEKPATDLPVTTPTITLTDIDSPFDADTDKKQESGSKYVHNTYYFLIYDDLYFRWLNISTVIQKLKAQDPQKWR